jgi:hypothetical protein
MKIKEDQIAEKLSVCPYCYEPQGDKYVCCGENHFEEGYITEDGEIYLESDVTIEDIPYYEIEERLMNKKADDAYDKWKDEQC